MSLFGSHDLSYIGQTICPYGIVPISECMVRRSCCTPLLTKNKLVLKSNMGLVRTP